MKMLKLALIGIVVLLISGVVAFYVDYYYYSWTSYINPFGCRCKEITVKFAGVDKRNDILPQQYDFAKIGEQTKLDSNYDVHYYDESKLFVTRIYGNVPYSISFSRYNSANGFYTIVSFSNSEGKIDKNKNLIERESKNTPNAYIIRNITQMIEEIPLNDEQKNELKSKVGIRCESGIRFP